MPEISVTIPVYNVEDYLRRCLDTVLDQTFKQDYEIICVDDGSTDSSLQILKEYDKKYPGKFKIIQQENKGLSDARNIALEYVTGKYTMFVDADDFIAKNALESLYGFAEKHNSEVVVFDFLKGIKGNNNFNLMHYKSIKDKYGDSAFNAETADDYVYVLISVATWSKFYLTDFIKNIKFQPGLNNQDVCHWTEVYTKAERINYLPVPLYFYVMQRENAITMNKGKKVFDVFTVFNLAEKTLRNAGMFEKYKVCFYILFASYLMCATKKIYPELRKEFIERIKSYEIDIDYEKILKGNYARYQKEDIYFIKSVKENDYETVEKFCYEKRIWTKEQVM